MIDFLESKFSELALGKVPTGNAVKGRGRFAVATSLGLVRSRNEDRCAILRVRSADNPLQDMNIGVVCDGLGGMQAGAEAAAAGLATFLAVLVRTKSISTERRLRQAIDAANRRVFEMLRGNGGTTLTAAVVVRSQGTFVCHVGDSRLSVIGRERAVTQLTRDDTMAALLGKSLPEGERDNRLVQFVGLGDDLDPQVFSVEESGGTLLLTTDGAHDLPLATFKRVVTAAASPTDLAKRLTQLSEILGGVDNASVAVIPNYFEDERLSSSGTELLLTLPGEEVTIILPPNLPRADVPERSSSKDKEKELTSSSAPPKKRTAKSKSGSSGPTKPRKKSQKKKSSEGELPLEQPRVNVEFPDDERGRE